MNIERFYGEMEIASEKFHGCRILTRLGRIHRHLLRARYLLFCCLRQGRRSVSFLAHIKPITMQMYNLLIEISESPETTFFIAPIVGNYKETFVFTSRTNNRFGCYRIK